MSKESLVTSLRITLVGIFVVIIGLISDHFAKFLGDFRCDIVGVCHSSYTINYAEHTHWGMYHWIVAMTVFFIVLVQLIEIFKKEL